MKVSWHPYTKVTAPIYKCICVSKFILVLFGAADNKHQRNKPKETTQTSEKNLIGTKKRRRSKGGAGGGREKEEKKRKDLWKEEKRKGLSMGNLKKKTYCMIIKKQTHTKLKVEKDSCLHNLSNI